MSGEGDRDGAAVRKARGAFFTPQPVADHLVTWAVRDRADVVVEPSCGEARQPVRSGDLLGAQVFLHRERVVRAALDGGVVGDDDALPAAHPADPGDDPG
jgi:hypothetical protein